jgi:hypothetical protein
MGNKLIDNQRQNVASGLTERSLRKGCWLNQQKEPTMLFGNDRIRPRFAKAAKATYCLRNNIEDVHHQLYFGSQSFITKEVEHVVGEILSGGNGAEHDQGYGPA